MDKLDFLFKFRRANNDETLEKMVFDKVPKSAWKFVK